MRAPNKYGTIVNLGKGRRRPWAVRITTGYHENGSPITKYISYHESKPAAFKARDEYNRIHGSGNENGSPTFGEVLSQWQLNHFPTLTEGTIDLYETAINRLAFLNDREIAKISFSDLQEYVDTLPKEGQKKRARSILKQVFAYAYKKDYVVKNVAVGLDIGKSKKSTKHFKYNAEEIQALWDHVGDLVADFVLITVYSGMRPGELQKLKNENIDLDQRVFVIEKGKTENARRNIPIHSAIMPIITRRMSDGGYLFPESVNRSTFHTKHFKEALDSYGILWYIHPATREKQQHLPHDGRHTFASRWQALQLDEAMRRYIQGHSGQGIGEQVYIHFDPEDLAEEIDKLYF